MWKGFTCREMTYLLEDTQPLTSSNYDIYVADLVVFLIIGYPHDIDGGGLGH